MGEGQSNPLVAAQELVNTLRANSDSAIHSQLDDLARLLDQAVRQGQGEDAEALRARMEEMIALNAQFVSVMVHEIRVPMTSIKGYSDMLGKGVVGPLSEQQQMFVDTIRSNVTRMEHLVSDISDISKLNSGRVRLDPKMDLYKNIAMMVEKKVADLAAQHNHTLTFDTPSGLPMLNLDGNRLAQVIEKLVVNAIQYTPDGGQITVKAEATDEGWLKVSVIDNGIGMSEADQAHIGELFWRSDSEHVRNFKGHGLGLPIAIGFIKLFGGRFFFESTLDKGSVFGFVVPGMN